MRNLSLLILCVFLGRFGWLATAAPGQVVVEGPSLFTGAPIQVSSDGVKGIVVLFLSSSCPCSNSHVTELKNLAKEHPDFRFVAVHSNADEELKDAQAYFKAQDLTLPLIQDQATKIADRFKAFKTPHAFVVLADGRTAYEGGVSDSHEFENAKHKYLREALDDLSSGKKVRTPMARTLGCTISRRGHAG